MYSPAAKDARRVVKEHVIKGGEVFPLIGNAISVRIHLGSIAETAEVHLFCGFLEGTLEILSAL